MAVIHSEDLYERLGISRTASRDEVRQAYRALLRTHPPERAPEEFKRIREAYETLNDANSRTEYDRAPSASVQRSVQLASAAMEAHAYGEAELHLKRVLLEDPDLDFARNWLGLCFWYQDKAEQAIAQFERLLQRAQIPAHWYGNAGYAYRSAGRLMEAERMFRRAVIVGDAEGDDVADYYVGLADLLIDQDHYIRAESVLEQAIRHDGEIDFRDMQFFAKLLEVQVLQNDSERMMEVISRIHSVARDQDERWHAALKVGSLAKTLVACGRFSDAFLLSSACKHLQPEDADYEALAHLSLLFVGRQTAAITELLIEHPSFYEDGWLHSLFRPAIEQKVRMEMLYDSAVDDVLEQDESGDDEWDDDEDDELDDDDDDELDDDEDEDEWDDDEDELDGDDEDDWGDDDDY